MVKRKIEDTKSIKRRYIDIIYSEFDSDENSDEDPEWLPPDSSSESDSETESQKS